MGSIDLTEIMQSYWTDTHLKASLIVALNILGALVLGVILGYERTYRGRAAGMRTYGLVCMVSAGMLSICAFPDLWFGAQLAGVHFQTDPTRTIQGILTGIGFLCAGVIMKEGFSITGLTTAASIWAVSSIGILVGVGFYLAAIALVLGVIMCMTLVSNVETYLPVRAAIAVRLKFKKNVEPDMKLIRQAVDKHGFIFTQSSVSISVHQESMEWNFIVLTPNRQIGDTLPELAGGLKSVVGVEDIYLSHSRN